jgi:hypothetical protein
MIRAMVRSTRRELTAPERAVLSEDFEVIRSQTGLPRRLANGRVIDMGCIEADAVRTRLREYAVRRAQG